MSAVMSRKRLDYTLAEAAEVLRMTPGALRVFLFRHPEIERRYRHAPHQRAQYRCRLLLPEDVDAIRRVRTDGLPDDL